MSDVTDQIRHDARGVSEAAWSELPHEQHATCYQLDQMEQLTLAVCALVDTPGTELAIERRALLLQCRRWEEARELLVDTLPFLSQYIDADPVADTLGVVSDLYLRISEGALGIRPEDVSQ